MVPGALSTKRTRQKVSVLDAALDGTFGADGSFMPIGTTTPRALDLNQDGDTTDPTDVANAYTELRMLVTPCTDNPVGTGVGEADRLFGDAYPLRPGPDDTASQAYKDAKALQDAYDGPVYDARYSELEARESVSKAIREWNNLLLADDGDADTTSYGEALTAYRAIVVDQLITSASTAAEPAHPYGSMGAQGFHSFYDGTTQESLTTLIAGGLNVNTVELADLDDDTTNGILGEIFDASGDLQLDNSGTGGSGVAHTDIDTLGEIADELAAWNTLVKRQEAQIASRDEKGLSTVADDDRLILLKRAQKHVADQLGRLTTLARNNVHDADDNDVVDTGETSAQSNLSAYNTASTRLRGAMSNLKSAVEKFESARTVVSNNLKEADTYLDQLVELRQWELANATDEEKANAKSGVNTNLKNANAQHDTHDELTGGDPDNPASALLDALVKPDTLANGKANPEDDDGLALVNAISKNYEKIQEVADSVPDALDTSAITTRLDGHDTGIGDNADDITDLDGRVSTNETDIAANEADIADLNMELYGPTSSQHSDAVACAEGAGGLVNIANCAAARSRHNEQDIADLDGDVEALGGRVDDNEDAIAMNAEGIAMNAEGIMTNAGNIAMNAEGIMTNMGNIAMNAEGIMTNMGNIAMNAEGIMTNMGNIAANAEGIITNAGNIAMNSEYIMANSGKISSNADAIAANMNSIGQNSAMISDNRNMIGELSDDLGVVRAGVAASMALAGMPAVNGRGIAIGVGSFDGESAFAVGFQIQGEQASFKVGVTSGGGATGASAGVGFNF